MKRLTNGTRIRDRIIKIAPALIGEARFSGSDAADAESDGNQPKPNRTICTSVNLTPEIRLVQTAAFMIFLLNSPYKNGPKNAPDNALQE